MDLPEQIGLGEILTVKRGTFQFEVGRDGTVLDTPTNLTRLKRLLTDWQIIDGQGGPGVTNDGRGAWHVFCHLSAAGGVFRLPNGRGAWVGVGFDRANRRYAPALFLGRHRGSDSLPLRSSGASDTLLKARWMGFVEGASKGHILDRSATDPGNPTTDDRRQDYDQNVNSSLDGGPVWEHWTVSRDISTPLGHSLVSAYLTVLATLGGRYAATVARGRSDAEYGHLRQLCAMVESGLLAPSDVAWDVDPRKILPDVETVLYEATPDAFARAADLLVAGAGGPTYFMYERMRRSFVPLSLLKALQRSGPLSTASS